MHRFTRESALLEPVSATLRNRTFRMQREEVQFYEYSVDLFGYSDLNDMSMAVELKLLKWKRALEQCLVYQLCADLVYLALPETSRRLVDLDLLRSYGIGLISVQSPRRCEIVVKARQSGVVKPNYRDFYIRLLQESHHGHRAA